MGPVPLQTESPVLHAESSCILHAKEFLLYFTWPLIVALLTVLAQTLPQKMRTETLPDLPSLGYKNEI